MSSTLFSKRHKEKSGRNRRPRPKTFKTEQAAKQHAEKKGIGDYSIVAAKKKRFALKRG